MPRKILIFITALLLAVMAFAPHVAADQTVIPDYATARDDYFWIDLYRAGGESLYCQEAFSVRDRDFNVEHVYPASWMKEAGNCERTISREECQRNSDRFNLMEADLHNLYPALRGCLKSLECDLIHRELQRKNAAL